MARLLTNLAPLGEALGGSGRWAEGPNDRDFCEMTERVILECAASRRGVILGRAGAVVLGDHPTALHVRLDGPTEARVRQAMRIQSIDDATARRRMVETDAARHAYVRHFHHVDARDPSLYHLVIDSTAIDLGVCVELIVAAAEARAAHPAAST